MTPGSEDPGRGREALLAFDTSGPYGSVVVSVDGVVRAGAVLPERSEHAARLLPSIHQVLQEVGLEIGDLSGLVVGEGPGSFTGVRVAAATAKGLVMARGIALRPVSSLAAAAAVSVLDGPSASPATGIRYALFDARGDRVYGACYELEAGGMRELSPPHPGRVTDVLDGDVPAGAVFTGDGAVKHRARLEEAGYRVAAASRGVPLAAGLLACARLGAAPAIDDPTSWEPRYVRASSAEQLWSTP